MTKTVRAERLLRQIPMPHGHRGPITVRSSRTTAACFLRSTTSIRSDRSPPRSLRGGKILNHIRPGDSRLAGRGRRVPAATDEARDTRAYDRADRGDVAMFDRGQRGGLRTAIGRVEQHDVGGMARFQETAVEPIHLRIVA